MKSYYLIYTLTILSTLLLTMCDGLDSEIKTREEITVSVSELSRDSLEEIFLSTISEIDRNLEFIMKQEGMIILGPNSNVEGSIDKKERIARNIQMINALLEENRQKIEKLETLINTGEHRNQQLEKILDDRANEFRDQTEQIAKLKEELLGKDFEINDLNHRLSKAELRISKLNNLLGDMESKLFKAHYAVGTFRELKDNRVVEKLGGLLWFGKVKTLQEDFNQEYFTEVDIRDTRSIALYGKKARILTKHPEDSYDWEQKDGLVTNLLIKDPGKFWEANKYLVIEVSI